MKIIFFGDSITDAGRSREQDNTLFSYGNGYVRQIAGDLLAKRPNEYEIINRGINGDRIVDLYARIKKDVWNLQPDVLSILVGINDIWHELAYCNGVDVERYEKVYTMLIEDTIKRLPNTKIILCEPFVLKGNETEGNFDQFIQVKKYALVVKEIAKKFNLEFLPLQDKLDKVTEDLEPSYYLSDGVHPSVAGASLIADEWLKLFNNKIKC